MHDTPRTAPVRVAVATEVRLYQEGLVRLLSGRADVVVVGTDPPPPDGLERPRPEVVLIDAASCRGTALPHAVADALPDVRLVTFAVAEEDDDEVIACVEAGAVGFVARNATADELLAVIHSAARGEVRCSPKIAALVFRRVARAGAMRWACPPDAVLTAREAQILDLVDAGLANKEIAARLGIGTATVKSHVHNVLEKLHLRRRAEAAAYVRARRRVRI